MLSPRVIHFTHKQIYWECTELCANETFLTGLPDPFYMEYLGKRNVSEMIEELSSPPLESLDEDEKPMYFETRCFRLWENIVSIYTERALRFQSDKLAALSGIVKYLEPFLGPTYLAGIWRNQCMVAQLAWRVGSPSFFKVPCKYKMPTWSWAVTDQPVLFCRWLTYRNLVTGYTKRLNEYPYDTCTILDAQSTPATDDPTGAVDGGFLLVEGYLNPISIHSNKAWLNGEELNLSIFLDRPINESGRFYLFSLYWIKGIAYTRDREADWNELECIVYLILTPILGHQGSYERCGAAEGEICRSPKPKWGTDGGPDMPSEEYSGGGSKHRIRIF